MKVHIENRGCSILDGLQAVKQYIIDYRYKETLGTSGTKVFHVRGSNHVSCKKTKTGNYTFTVWLAK
jgi:hypothetical protein